MDYKFDFPQTYTKLNIACGPVKENILPEPWLNIDIKSEYAYFELDATNLPEKWENSFWEVRASHVIEHFFLEDWPTVLSHWIKVLKPGGILRISLPDFEIVLQNLNKLNNLDHKGRPVLSLYEQTAALTQIYGVGYMTKTTEERWRHRVICNKETFCSYLEAIHVLKKVYSVPKELDTGMMLGIHDDSQNSWSMTICAEKSNDISETTLSKHGPLFEPQHLLVFNKEGQILIIEGSNGPEIPKIGGIELESNWNTVIEMVEQEYKVIISDVSRRYLGTRNGHEYVTGANLDKILPTDKIRRQFLLLEEFFYLKHW